MSTATLRGRFLPALPSTAVRYDIEQTLTNDQKTQARENIGALGEFANSVDGDLTISGDLTVEGGDQIIKSSTTGAFPGVTVKHFGDDTSWGSIAILKGLGSESSPAYPGSADVLGSFGITNYSNGAGGALIQGVASEAHGASATGTKLEVYVTPNTTTARALALTIEQDGRATFADWIVAAASRKRVSTQFDKTDTTLANVTGLSVSVKAARVYAFRAVLYCTSAGAGGAKVTVAGTATATLLRANARIFTGATLNVQATGGTLGTSLGGNTSAVDLIEIVGTLVVNAAGTFTVQFAQNAASGTSSVLTGSTFLVEDVT